MSGGIGVLLKGGLVCGGSGRGGWGLWVGGTVPATTLYPDLLKLVQTFQTSPVFTLKTTVSCVKAKMAAMGRLSPLGRFRSLLKKNNTPKSTYTFLLLPLFRNVNATLLAHACTKVLTKHDNDARLTSFKLFTAVL